MFLDCESKANTFVTAEYIIIRENRPKKSSGEMTGPDVSTPAYFARCKSPKFSDKNLCDSKNRVSLLHVTDLIVPLE